MLDPSWRAAFGAIAGTKLERPQELLDTETRAGRPFFPRYENVMRAFTATPFIEVRVVILGQDPYDHEDGFGKPLADGLAFSVREGLPRLPHSLKNIFAEIERDLGHPPRVTGSLEPWAHEGVLLLNTTLTVAPGGQPSHRGHGWAQFTTLCVQVLSKRRAGIVFLLWGGHAGAKRRLIDEDRHHVLVAGHPSPHSVSRFQGCGHFSSANALLNPPINW